MSEVPIANMPFCPTVTRPRSSQGTARWTGFASRASTRRRCSVGFSTRKPATGASARSRARGGCAARPVPVGGKVKPWELDAAGKAILGAVARRGGELLERARPRHLGGARQATTRSSSRGTTPSRPRRSIGSTCGRAGPARAPRGRKGRATTGSSSTAVRTRRRSVLPRPAPRCLLDRRASRLLARRLPLEGTRMPPGPGPRQYVLRPALAPRPRFCRRSRAGAPGRRLLLGRVCAPRSRPAPGLPGRAPPTPSLRPLLRGCSIRSRPSSWRCSVRSVPASATFQMTDLGVDNRLSTMVPGRARFSLGW